MAELSCPVTGCRYVVHGINKEDVLKQMAQHRRHAHERKEDVGPGRNSVK
jgi:predicted small metal-binding protein